MSHHWFDFYVLGAKEDDGWQMSLVSLSLRAVSKEETTSVCSMLVFFWRGNVHIQADFNGSISYESVSPSSLSDST